MRNDTAKIVDRMKKPSDLIDKWYLSTGPGGIVKKNRHEKIINIYEKRPMLTGHGLELGFGLCTSIHWLFQRYDKITLDAVDKNNVLKPIIPLVRKLYTGKLWDVWIGDMQNSGKSNNYYDFINSCSVWEHLSENVYWQTLDECYRILKPGGLIGVYVDAHKSKRTIPQSQAKTEMESKGFKAITPYLFRKP